MADDKQLVILKRITEVLQKITPANGYQHDLAKSVFRGRTSFDKHNDPVPLVTIFARTDDIEQLTNYTEKGTKHQFPWALICAGFCTADKQNPIDPAHLLLADCKKALATISEEGNSDYLLTMNDKKLISRISISPGVVIPPDENTSQNKVQFLLHFTVGMVEDIANPYLL